MPVIDGVASYGPSALQQFQPRPPQANSPDGSGAGSDNPAVQQFQQALQTPPAAPPTETQTANAVQQPAPPPNPAPPQPPANNNGSNNGLSLSDILEQANARSPQNDSEPPSALNYNASGTPNPAQRPTQAGQLVSLSV